MQKSLLNSGGLTMAQVAHLRQGPRAWGPQHFTLKNLCNGNIPKTRTLSLIFIKGNRKWQNRTTLFTQQCTVWMSVIVNGKFVFTSVHCCASISTWVSLLQSQSEFVGMLHEKTSLMSLLSWERNYLELYSLRRNEKSTSDEQQMT